MNVSKLFRATLVASVASATFLACSQETMAKPAPAPTTVQSGATNVMGTGTLTGPAAILASTSPGLGTLGDWWRRLFG